VLSQVNYRESRFLPLVLAGQRTSLLLGALERSVKEDNGGCQPRRCKLHIHTRPAVAGHRACHDSAWHGSLRKRRSRFGGQDWCGAQPQYHDPLTVYRGVEAALLGPRYARRQSASCQRSNLVSSISSCAIPLVKSRLILCRRDNPALYPAETPCS
jgi:hypothetical protein